MPIFVDDITLASKSQKALDDTVEELVKHFPLRDLGPTSFLLGIHITRDIEPYLYHSVNTLLTCWITLDLAHAVLSPLLWTLVFDSLLKWELPSMKTKPSYSLFPIFLQR